MDIIPWCAKRPDRKEAKYVEYFVEYRSIDSQYNSRGEKWIYIKMFSIKKYYKSLYFYIYIYSIINQK